MPFLEVFLAVAFEDALASGILRPEEMSDSLVSLIFVLLLFRRKFLELLLKLLVEPLAGIAAFVCHVFACDGIVRLVPLAFLLGLHEFSALGENGVFPLGEVGHMAHMVGQQRFVLLRVYILYG